MKYYDIYCLEGEEWKNIPGYEWIYQASTYGRIRSVDGKITHSIRHGKRKWKGRILHYKGDNKKTGYRVSLWKDKQEKSYLVARLVCMTFHGIPNDFYDTQNSSKKMTVNHKDGNRFNNRIENLEWLTLADNIRHGFDNGLYRGVECLLTNPDGTKIYCKTFSAADKYLGRYKGYLSNSIKNNRKIIGENGRQYELELFKEA